MFKSSRDGFNILDNFNISSIKTAIVNMIVMRHNRWPSMQISHKLVVLRYIVDGFGLFWLVLFVVIGSFGWFHVLVTMAEDHNVSKVDEFGSAFIIGLLFYCNRL